MPRHNRGTTFSSFLIGSVVFGATAVSAMYFFSDTFRTRANSAVRDFSEWTPENIADDPINYLNFAEEQTRDTLDELKASEIAIAQKRARLEQLGTDATEKVTLGEEALVELKAAYKRAEADAGWPIEWSGAERDRSWTKRQIVSLFRQVESQRGLIEKVEHGRKQLDIQLAKVHEARAQCDGQIARIQTHREILKVEEITDALTAQLVEMKSVIRTTIASTTALQSGELVSLDDLASHSEGTVDDSEFESILSR